MKERKNWIDYMIYLFWAFLIFTIILDLFLVPARTVYWVGALLISLLIYRRKFLPKPIYLIMAVMFVFQVFGELYFGFFYTLPHYDKIDHIISGIEFGTLFYFLFDRKIKDKKQLIWIAFLFSLSFEYAWEIIEYFSDIYLGTTTVGVVLRSPGEYINSAARIIMPAYLDTIQDMIYSFVGAVVFVIGGFILTRKRR